MSRESPNLLICAVHLCSYSANSITVYPPPPPPPLPKKKKKKKKEKTAKAKVMPAISAVLSRLPFSFPSLAGRNPKPRTMPPARRPLASSSAAGSDDGSQPKPWLFVGLGNPGKLYHSTRHNVGFEMIDVIAEAEGISLSSIQFKAMLGKGRIGDSPVMLAKPQTFMNASGRFAGFILQDTTESSTSDV